MSKAIIGLALCSLLLAPDYPAEAQQAAKVPRIGLLYASASANSARIDAFQQGLRDLGYVEGKNILIEYRYADGKLDRFSAYAAELVHFKVTVIVTGGPTATRSAQEATATIPIVMAQDSDPVGNGFVTSLARPGGNITGLSSLSLELSGKRLEFLKESVPKLSRIAVLGNSTNPGNSQSLKETELAARVLKVQLLYFDLRSPQDIETAFREASKGHADAVLVLNFPPFMEARIPNFAAKGRLPAIYYNSATVHDGGLMSYGASFLDLDRRAATYVDRILKGAKPAELPVEQPTKFEFVINLKTATQIGLTIPPNVLARADKVIR